MPVMRYDSGFADLKHTNMCYRCDWCDQGYNRIIYLAQVGLDYFMCDRCREYYKVSYSDAKRLQFVTSKREWISAVGLWVPDPFWRKDDDD
jgi:hypothetical protein